jgi:GNAT superfamily N-acetyltransferase
VTLVVRRTTAAEIFALRHAVLRPGYPESASDYPEDATAVHVGAWDGDHLVGCATVFPEPWPGSAVAPDADWAIVPAVEAAWRLRGVAVDPASQGRGVGRTVLAEVAAAAREGAAPLLWANARSTALAFYGAAGWTVAGPEFLTKDTGLPHRAMTVSLAP